MILEVLYSIHGSMTLWMLQQVEEKFMSIAECFLMYIIYTISCIKQLKGYLKGKGKLDTVHLWELKSIIYNYDISVLKAGKNQKPKNLITYVLTGPKKFPAS